MSRYGKIESGFWHSPKVRKLSEHGKFLLLYLFSCPHGNAIGCFVLPVGYVSADLGWSDETVTQTLSELFQKGLIERDEATFLTRVLGWWGHNSIENANVAKHVCKEILSLPNCEVRQRLIETILNLPELHETVMQTLSEGLPKPFRNQEPNLTLQEPILLPVEKATGEKPAAKSGRRKTKTPLPEPWVTSEDNRAKAKKLGFSNSEIDIQAEMFCNHAKVNDRRCVDWVAAERNWFIKAAEFAKKKPAADGAPDAGIEWPKLVAFFKKGGAWPRFAGPQPGFSGCRVPPEILREHGYLPRDAPGELKLVSV